MGHPIGDASLSYIGSSNSGDRSHRGENVHQCVVSTFPQSFDNQLTRTVFVVMALSFHSTIEGLALALEDEASGVWLNTGT